MRARGDRVLLFSQSTMMLDVLQDYMHLRRWTYERLDGSARAEERWAAVSAFSGNRPGGGSGGGGSGGGGSGGGGSHGVDPFVFLLSTRAGGLGLNLTAANTVIFYDHDWNPQADLQATDRVHRLGQTRPVLVVRLVCEGSVEEVILRRAHAKMLASRGLLAEDDEPSGADKGIAPGAAAEAIQFGLANLYANHDTDGSVPPSMAVEASSTPAPPRPLGPSDAEIDAVLCGGKPLSQRPDVGIQVEAYDSIYVFDGVDFALKATQSASGATGAGGSAGAVDPQVASDQARDVAALKRLVQQDSRTGGDVAALSGYSTDLIGRGRRSAAPLSDAEAAAERARLATAAAAAEAARKDKALQRKRDKWRKAGYTSAALPDVSSGTATWQSADVSGDPDATDSDADDESPGRSSGPHRKGGSLRFAVGDAMASAMAPAAVPPSQPAHDSPSPRIVVVWVDVSGRWNTRGFFRSVSAATGAPQAAYEAAHENGDLSLGDAHLVDCSATSAGLHVALLAVLDRDKRAPYGTPPTLSTAALDTALGRLAAAAVTMQASIHSPRLQANGSSWYTVERLMRKHMLRTVPTTVYYFRR